MALIPVILFDLDDTLHDRAASLRAFAADQHRRWFAHALDADLFIRRFLTLDANGHRPKAEVYACLLDELGLDGREAALLLADYNRHYHDFAMPRAGAVSTLEALRSRGTALGIVSNGWTDFQHRTIAASGLASMVDVVLISEREGLRKPDKRLFERAAERLGVTPGQCLFVGDNPWADIDGARRAGMQTAWIVGGFAWPGDLAAADRQLTALQDLLDGPA